MTRSPNETQSDPLPPIRPGVVDLRETPDPAAALHTALLKHGFVAVRHCDVGAALRDRALQSAREFFALDQAQKDAQAYTDTQQNFGYQGLHTEALDPATTADVKEAFTMRSLSNRAQHADNATKNQTHINAEWSATPFGHTATAMYAACSATALNLLTMMERALDAPSGTFTHHHTGENMTLRYLHYPSVDATQSDPTGKKNSQLGAGAHTDYGTITLLFSDGVAGLQLFDPLSKDPESFESGLEPDSNEQKEGRWRDVEVAPGDVLVNTGDLMSVWSNGKYPSTLHRVLPRLGKPARYSMAFFVDPDSCTNVEPLGSCISEESPARTNAVNAGEHIQARIEASQRIAVPQKTP